MLFAAFLPALQGLTFAPVASFRPARSVSMRFNRDGQQNWSGAQVQWIFEGGPGVQPMPQNQFPALPKYHRLPYILRNPGDEQVLGFYNLVYQNPAVDRVQCMIKIQPDGTLTLVGCGGKAPTLVRNFDGQWNPLYKGQVTQIRPGDFVSLDCNNPDSAVFGCWGEPIQQQQQQQGGYGQQQGGYGQQQGGYGQQQGGYGQQGGYQQQGGGYGGF